MRSCPACSGPLEAGYLTAPARPFFGGIGWAREKQFRLTVFPREELTPRSILNALTYMDAFRCTACRLVSDTSQGRGRRIGERSSHTWFVLKYLLGYPNVRNYDGSWTEWGNLVRTPIEE